MSRNEKTKGKDGLHLCREPRPLPCKASPPPPWLSHSEVHAFLPQGSALAMGLRPSPSPTASLTVDEDNADHGKDEKGKRLHGDFHHDCGD